MLPCPHIRQILSHPKNIIPDCQKPGVVYSITCASCDLRYFGQTGRTLNDRIKEHMAAYYLNLCCRRALLLNRSPDRLEPLPRCVFLACRNQKNNVKILEQPLNHHTFSLTQLTQAHQSYMYVPVIPCLTPWLADI